MNAIKHILAVTYLGTSPAPAFVGDYDYTADYLGHPKYKQYNSSTPWFIQWIADATYPGFYLTDTENVKPTAPANGAIKSSDAWLSWGLYGTNLAQVSAHDPLTEVFIALWDLIDSSSYVAAVVAYRNRQHLFAGKFGLEKNKRSTADFPEIDIEPSGGGFNPADSSSTVMVRQDFTVSIRGEDKRTWADFFPVKIALARALAKIDWFNGRPLTLGNVTRAMITGHNDMAGEYAPKGWTSSQTISFEIRFDRSTFKGT